MANIEFWTALVSTNSDSELRAQGFNQTEIVEMRYQVRRHRKEARR